MQVKSEGHGGHLPHPLYLWDPFVEVLILVAYAMGMHIMALVLVGAGE
jgi:hypothetical protein